MTMLAQGEQGKSADNRGERPLLRGWLHVGAFFAWLIGGPFLIAAAPGAVATAELAVYVAGMLAMFGTSAAFHRLRWSAAAWRRMRRADHSAIFIGIAGTCTAVVGLSLRGWAEILLLSLVSFYGVLQLPGVPAREGEGLRKAPALTLALESATSG